MVCRAASFVNHLSKNSKFALLYNHKKLKGNKFRKY